MSVSTMTVKGQTTIPIQIRAYLNLHPGDKLEFFIDEEGQVVLAPLTSDVKRLKGMLPRPKKTVSIDKMNKAIKARGAKHARR